MKLIEKTQICNNLDDLPDFRAIKSLPRRIRLKIVFGNKIKSKREKIGEQWELEHPKFQIAIHTIEPEINIVKLITDKEIEEHQDFFEKCAKDYRSLATKLINEFAHKHNLKIDSEYPMNTLNPSEQLGYKQTGEINGWEYMFHGFHCAFTNLESGQHIEVPLMCGLEFGELDPYFYSEFINSTKEYEQEVCKIYDDYSDGIRILERMIELGKFEKIQSNWPNRESIVVKDRVKVEVKVYHPDPVSESKKIDTVNPIVKTRLWYKLKSLFNK